MSKLRFDLGQETFADLHLRHNGATDVLSFNPEPLDRVLTRNGFAAGTLPRLRTAALEDAVLSWYLHHVRTGGRCSLEETEAVMRLRSEGGLDLVPTPAAEQPHRRATPAGGMVQSSFARLRGSLRWLGEAGVSTRRPVLSVPGAVQRPR